MKHADVSPPPRSNDEDGQQQKRMRQIRQLKAARESKGKQQKVHAQGSSVEIDLLSRVMT